MADEKWFTTSQIAELLQVTEHTVRLWLRERRMRGINLGGKTGWRVRESDVNAFIEDLEGKAAA